MTVSEQISFAGFLVSSLAFGVSLLSLFISLMNYRRDRANLHISLNVGWKVVGAEEYDENKEYLVVNVHNVGRRPEFIEMVATVFADGSSGLAADGFLKQNKISEGDPPAKYLIEQEGLRELPTLWAGMVVVVRTSTGRQYRSRFLNSPPNECRPIGFFGRLLQRIKVRIKARWAFKRRILF